MLTLTREQADELITQIADGLPQLIVATWDESKHPRVPDGQKGGGQFTDGERVDDTKPSAEDRAHAKRQREFTKSIHELDADTARKILGIMDAGSDATTEDTRATMNEIRKVLGQPDSIGSISGIGLSGAGGLHDAEAKLIRKRLNEVIDKGNPEAATQRKAAKSLASAASRKADSSGGFGFVEKKFTGSSVKEGTSYAKESAARAEYQSAVEGLVRHYTDENWTRTPGGNPKLIDKGYTTVEFTKGDERIKISGKPHKVGAVESSRGSQGGRNTYVLNVDHYKPGKKRQAADASADTSWQDDPEYAGIIFRDAAWDESKHPRDDDGKWTEGEGSDSGVPADVRADIDALNGDEYDNLIYNAGQQLGANVLGKLSDEDPDDVLDHLINENTSDREEKVTRKLVQSKVFGRWTDQYIKGRNIKSADDVEPSEVYEDAQDYLEQMLSTKNRSARLRAAGSATGPFRSLAATGGKVRRASLFGEPHLVVPVRALVEGVIFAHGAPSPEFIPADVYSRHAMAWNVRPVMAGHPMVNGQMVSAADPAILDARHIGWTFASRYDDSGKALDMEAWINERRAAAMGGDPADVVRRLQRGETIEVSIGAHVDVDPNAAGEHKGRAYRGAWRAVSSDHLAFLRAGERGACSIEMGCGAQRAAADSDPDSLNRAACDGKAHTPDGLSHTDGTPCACGHGANNPTRKDESTMDETRIAALIASPKNAYTDAHRPFLKSLSADQFKALEDLDKIAADPKPRTAQEYAADAPAEIRDVLLEGVRAAAARKAGQVAQLRALGAKRCPYSDEALNAMSSDELANLITLAGVVTDQPAFVDFSGRAPRAASDQRNPADDPYLNPPDPYAAPLKALQGVAS